MQDTYFSPYDEQDSDVRSIELVIVNRATQRHRKTVRTDTDIRSSLILLLLGPRLDHISPVGYTFKPKNCLGRALRPK